MLVIFTFSITPEKHLHDLVADHKDFYGFQPTDKTSVGCSQRVCCETSAHRFYYEPSGSSLRKLGKQSHPQRIGSENLLLVLSKNVSAHCLSNLKQLLVQDLTFFLNSPHYRTWQKDRMEEQWKTEYRPFLKPENSGTGPASGEQIFIAAAQCFAIKIKGRVCPGFDKLLSKPIDYFGQTV